MCSADFYDIAWNIFGGVLTAVIITGFQHYHSKYKHRKTNRLEGTYHIFVNAHALTVFWIKLFPNKTVIELIGGRDFNNFEDTTIEGQIVFQSTNSSSAIGYYIDSFTNSKSPDYIGNGKFYIKIIDKNTMRVSADYLTNQTHEGKSTTVMVKTDEIWKKQS